MFGNILQKPIEEIQEGMILFFIKDLFEIIEKPQEEFEINVKFSYLEIYNENIKDLLRKDDQSNEKLMILEDPDKGILIPDLSEFNVGSLKEVIDLMLLGNSRRIMASTGANSFSSRSHAIINVIVEKIPKNKKANFKITSSKLTLIGYYFFVTVILKFS